MGASCCVAVRDKPLPDQRLDVSSMYRNIRSSPSWSLRWDNRTHIEDIMAVPSRFSPRGGAISETETEGVSSEGSPPFDVSKKFSRNSKDSGAETSIVSDSLCEEKKTLALEGVVSHPSSETNSSISIVSHPSSSRTCSFPSDPTSSRQARRSPGFPLSRQVSDSRIPKMKSLNENNSPEGRQSFVYSMSDNDLSMGRSQGGSSEGWSMRTFSDLVSSSQRERWSFDSESIKGKLTRSNTQPLSTVPQNQQACGICSKLLKERSPWSPQKIVSNNELPIVAVLVCGHIYHADCLENLTDDMEKFEPPCPVCLNETKPTAKLSKKAESKAKSKISRIAVADADEHFETSSAVQKQGGKAPWMGTSSSMKSSSGQPFFRRHFSIGSRPTRSLSENENSRKKGFWAKYRRD